MIKYTRVSKYIYVLLFSHYSLFASTNLSAILSSRERQPEPSVCRDTKWIMDESSECDDGLESSRKSISEILNNTLKNQCIASKASIQESGVQIPLCPKSSDRIQGLDNTYPSGGVFSLYDGENYNFVLDVMNGYFKNSKVGVFNIVVPSWALDELFKNKEMVKALNNNRVNVIPVKDYPGSGRWMQDSFQFTSLNGKPLLYQMSHDKEVGVPFKERLACLISNACNLPYYIPQSSTSPFVDWEKSTLNLGGNLEVLPGGTFISGIQLDVRHKVDKDLEGAIKVNGSKNAPVRTYSQDLNKKTLEEQGNQLLELDISFLNIAHIDEIVNVVKTNREAPCDYAIILPSPNKAYELLENEAKKYPSSKGIDCTGFTHEKLAEKGKAKLLTEKEIDEIYKSMCFDGFHISDFVKSEIYKTVKQLNTEFLTIDFSKEKLVKLKNPTTYKGQVIAPATDMISTNRQLIRNKLIETTSCKEPVFIELPVFFRGDSVPPNIVNSLVQTPPGSASTIIMPRTYIKAFDDFAAEVLNSYGIETSFVHDMNYHIGDGEVHCGTNDARICRDE